MQFSKWIRKEIFWVLDFLTGSKVRKNYLDIRNIMENGRDSMVSKKPEEYLHGIMNYAIENVGFYKGYKSFDSVKSFPVINKNIIRDNYNEFQSLKFPDSSVVNMHTSGSTGTPFVVRQDKNKRSRVLAEMIYFWGKAGYQIGMRYGFLRFRTSMNRLTAWARNVRLWDIQGQDKENLEKIWNFLRSDHNIKLLLGFPSALENLANFILTCGYSPGMDNIHTIIGFGEAFPKSALAKLKRIFNCNIVSLYSNMENGMLALECIENKEFHVNSASYFIELLKLDSDDPVRVGEPGRIVVTDLFNHAMPLIRYDTGDVAIWKKEPECGWYSQVFSSIEGQKVDQIFDTRGNKKSPHKISFLLEPFDRLLQYQFVQEGAKRYALKLNGAEGKYDDAVFVDLLKDFLGQDAEILIEHIHEIPVLASGKRKEVVNNYRGRA
jgi:phenylacetate-coenzyme A ligase PaaK-like adenylate-forming protein